MRLLHTGLEKFTAPIQRITEGLEATEAKAKALNPLTKIPPKEMKEFLTNEVNRMIPILEDPSRVQNMKNGMFVVGDLNNDNYMGSFAALCSKNQLPVVNSFSFPSETKLGGRRRTIDCNFSRRELTIDPLGIDRHDVGNLFDCSKEPYGQLRDVLNKVVNSNVNKDYLKLVEFAEASEGKFVVLGIEDGKIICYDENPERQNVNDSLSSTIKALEQEDLIVRISPKELEPFFAGEAQRMISILKDHSQLEFKPFEDVNRNSLGETFQTFAIDDPRTFNYLGAFTVQFFKDKPPAKQANVLTFKSDAELAGKQRGIILEFNSGKLKMELMGRHFIFGENTGRSSNYNELRDVLNRVVASNTTLKFP